MDALTSGLALLLITIVLAVLLRPVALWYWRINEHIELERDIRDSLHELSRAQPAYAPEPRGAQVATTGAVVPRPGEDDDQFNSRVADALQRQFGR